MNPAPDKKAIEQAMEFARSPEGQRLLAMLQASHPDIVDTVQKQAAGGDMEATRQTVSKMMNSPDIKKLLKEMGNGHG